MLAHTYNYIHDDEEDDDETMKKKGLKESGFGNLVLDREA